jgi:hypothetical protein
MSLTDSLLAALNQPTPASLYALGSELRQRRLSATPAEVAALTLALQAAGAFYTFLSQVQAKITAEEYNRLASMLDLGSVGTVALQNVLSERADRLRRLLMGGVSETMMLIGSLQYIKAWEREAQALHEQAAWHLYDILWELSLLGQPALSGEERRRTIENLLAPSFDMTLPSAQRTIYLGWLFQLALLTAVAQIGAG